MYLFSISFTPLKGENVSFAILFTPISFGVSEQFEIFFKILFEGVAQFER